MIVVLDSNVWFSGLIHTDRPAGKILHRVTTGQITVCTTGHLWDELKNALGAPRSQKVLIKNFRLFFVARALTDFKIIVRRVPSIKPQKNWVPHHPADNWVVQCAVTAQADYIISGDRDLTSLGGSVEGIPIVTPRQFLDL